MPHQGTTNRIKLACKLLSHGHAYSLLVSSRLFGEIAFPHCLASTCCARKDAVLCCAPFASTGALRESQAFAREFSQETVEHDWWTQMMLVEDGVCLGQLV